MICYKIVSWACTRRDLLPRIVRFGPWFVDFILLFRCWDLSLGQYTYVLVWIHGTSERGKFGPVYGYRVRLGESDHLFLWTAKLSSTSFAGSLFLSSPGVRDGRKREPGNKVNLSSSKRGHARVRANHAKNDAQKGCAMQLNEITFSFFQQTRKTALFRSYWNLFSGSILDSLNFLSLWIVITMLRKCFCEVNNLISTFKHSCFNRLRGLPLTPLITDWLDPEISFLWQSVLSPTFLFFIFPPLKYASFKRTLKQYLVNEFPH